MTKFIIKVDTEIEFNVPAGKYRCYECPFNNSYPIGFMEQKYACALRPGKEYSRATTMLGKCPLVEARRPNCITLYKQEVKK